MSQLHPSIYQVDALGWGETRVTGTGITVAYGYARLHTAAVRGNVEMARELLKRGANVNIQGGSGEMYGQSAPVLAAP